jgi:hypothetical protein
MVNMQDAEVLHVSIFTNTDKINVTPYHCTWPNRAIFVYADLSNNGGSGVHINPFCDVWAMLPKLLNVI